jgi:hypothetical protein
LRFTGTDVVRSKTAVAREIAEFVAQKLNENYACLAEMAEREADYNELTWRRYGLP